MKDDRVLITGCGGMLGSAIYPFFIRRYKNLLATDKEVTEDWLHQLDVRDDLKVQQMFKDFRPQLVLHLAAETDLEYCETHPDITEATNSRATQNIAKLCETYNATLVYISTAGVFDGKKTSFYKETDPPNPIMVYGRTKYEGEIQTLKYASKAFVVRAGWMMGGGRKKEKKFIYKIIQQIATGQKNIYAVDDLWGTPTYAYDFAMNLFHLVKTRHYGIYHMACEGRGTRYDVARALINVCKRDDIQLVRVNSDFFSKEYFVVRPRSEMMMNANLTKIGLNRMRPWEQTLNEYIYDYYYDFVKMGNVDQAEKRKNLRRCCNTEVKYAIKDNMDSLLHDGVCIDASVSGLGLITNIELHPGQVLIFTNNSARQDFVESKIVQAVQHDNMRYRVGLESMF